MADIHTSSDEDAEQCEMEDRVISVKGACSTFIKDESGAITMDWVVLTAIALSICIGAYNVFGVSAPNPNDPDPNYSELDVVFQAWMEENGYSEVPERSMMDKIIRKIQVKMIVFKACMGYGMTYAGAQFLDRDSAETMCGNL